MGMGWAAEGEATPSQQDELQYKYIIHVWTANIRCAIDMHVNTCSYNRDSL